MMTTPRRPAEMQAEVPTSVYALDLTRLSELLRIDESELVTGFQAHASSSEMHGVVVDAGEDVPFETFGYRDDDGAGLPPQLTPTSMRPLAAMQRGTSFVSATLPSPLVPKPPQHQHQHPYQPEPPALHCRQVLLTAAARPSSLDSETLPKCLIPLGSQTIIAHILTQLYAAGMERIVISVAAGGAQIIREVQQSAFYSKMDIEFLDLGPENRDGHARSILAARALFRKGPFLIHTADHIFDKSLITMLMDYPLHENVACVLVEMDIAGLVGLPETTVKVQVSADQKIARIGRNLRQYDGIDAGLFLSSVAIFDALEELAARMSYFSLADALHHFTQSDTLAYTATAGHTWFSIETQEQLAYTKDNDGVSVLSPWTVFLATTPTLTVDDPMLNKNVVIGISSNDHDASLRVAGSAADARHRFDGFVVGVTNVDRRDEDMTTAGTALETQTQMIHVDKDDAELALEQGFSVNDSTPLLQLPRMASFASEATPSKMTRGSSFMDNGTVDEAFVISFPMYDDTTTESEEGDEAGAGTVGGGGGSAHHAYLIEMNPDPTTPVHNASQFMLAVPGRDVPLTPARAKHAILPSDIQEISLETKGYDDHFEVTVVVKRTVPLIGFLLLLTSLFTISSVGVALDMENNVTPLLKLFWRNCGTCLVSLPLALYSIRTEGGPVVTMDLALTMLMAGLSYAVFVGAYVVALDLTSVGHATLFNNAHSVVIVVLKLVLGQTVVLFEGLGAAIGVLGGAITTMDATTSTDDSVVSPTAMGDLVALLGAVGGAAYFVMAKKLRPKMEIVVFLSCLTGISACCLFVALLVKGEQFTWSMDEHTGLAGWLTPQPDRLLVTLYLVLVCDLVGTMGYISVMKYFEPIVISVVCLLEPIVATAMGIIAGVDSMPGALTFVGATLVIGGTALVISTESHKTEQHDATQAIKSAVSATPRPVYSTRQQRRSLNYGAVP